MKPAPLHETMFAPPLHQCTRETILCLKGGDHYRGISYLCHLVLHTLVHLMDACEHYDEASLLREAAVDVLQHSLPSEAPNQDRLIECCDDLGHWTDYLEGSEDRIGTPSYLSDLINVLTCVQNILDCLHLGSASAKCSRVIKMAS